LKTALTALLTLAGLDLLLVLVTGGASFLGSNVSPLGFLVRTLAVGMLLWARTRRYARRPWRTGPLVLVLLLLPTLLQFQYAGGRVNGDGIMYYVYVRSLAKDMDVDLTNEYAHYGLLERGDLSMPTVTGLRRSIFAVGPAVVWLPFFAVGELVARGQLAAGLPADLSGFGPTHRNAVALGSLLTGFLALLLVEDLLRRRFSEKVALAATLLLWGTTFLHWYMVQQPTMSHATSTFGAAAALWLWLTRREARGPFGFLLLGLVLGLAMCLRWQNAVLLVLPGVDLVARLLPSVRARRLERVVVLPALRDGALLALGTFLGALPQMWTWKALYDMWILPYPPHGTDFVRLGHPFVLETLFSSRHGLLSWTPVLWLGYLGFIPLLRRPATRTLGLLLLVPLVLMTYVNMCSGDWWAGGSFSNRRFDSLLPVFAFGFAAAVEWTVAQVRRRPDLAVAAAAVPVVGWNLLLAGQVHQNLVPRDDTVEFAALAGNGWRVMADAVGSPNTWPASWVFAARHGRPPGQYDLLVGRYLFYRQQNMGGHVEIGDPGDDVMLGEGWGGRESVQGVSARRIRGAARLFAPLDVPEDLGVRPRLHADVPVGVVVVVNGVDAGQVSAGPEWTQAEVRVPARFWHRELNEVRLQAQGEGVRVDAVDFVRAGGAWQAR
jgi:hypothetical protein